MRFFDKIRRAARYKRLLMIRAYKLKRTLPSYPRCKNCETELQGMYCHKCGQYALETKQSFWKFISEYFSNTYQTDGRAINTLKLLVTYPGFLSSEFVKGRVASYVHPMKLYLFSSIVFFAFMFLMTPSSDEIVKQSSTKTEQVADSLKNNSVALTTPAVKTADEDKPVKLYQQKFLVEAVFGILKQYMPLFMLLCLPLYGLLLSWFFRKRYKSYMPHFVFAIHLNIFILILTLLVAAIGVYIGFSQYMIWAAWLLLSLYVVVATRNFYGQRWFKSVMKSFFAFYIYYVFCAIVTGLALALLILQQVEELDM